MLLLSTNTLQERKAKKQRQLAWNKERLKYGKTAAGFYVDQNALEGLVRMGYDRTIAAEALRQVRAGLRQVRW